MDSGWGSSAVIDEDSQTMQKLQELLLQKKGITISESTKKHKIKRHQVEKRLDVI